MFLQLGEVAICMGFAICPRSTLLSPMGQGPAGPKVDSDLCLRTQFHRLWDCIFLASGVCPLVGEAGLEVPAGFLVGGTGACPLLGGVGSWSSGGQCHVKGSV